MQEYKFRFIIIPAIAGLAAIFTGLYLTYWADWVAHVLGHASALAFPVVVSLIWGAAVSVACGRGIRLAPVAFSGGASAIMVGWLLFNIARIH